jgi:hypothetical protein
MIRLRMCVCVCHTRRTYLLQCLTDGVGCRLPYVHTFIKRGVPLNIQLAFETNGTEKNIT